MSELIRAEPGRADRPLGTITIGIRRYSAATGRITTVQEPVTLEGEEPGPTGAFPLCQCRRCAPIRQAELERVTGR